MKNENNENLYKLLHKYKIEISIPYNCNYNLQFTVPIRNVAHLIRIQVDFKI